MFQYRIFPHTFYYFICLSLGNHTKGLGNLGKGVVKGRTDDEYEETTVVVKELEGSGSTDTTTKSTFEGIVCISTKYIFVMVNRYELQKDTSCFTVIFLLGCLGWKQTGGCDPDGTREPQNDRSCSTIIQNGWSGYCDCTSKRVKKTCVSWSYATCNVACASNGKFLFKDKTFTSFPFH